MIDELEKLLVLHQTLIDAAIKMNDSFKGCARLSQGLFQDGFLLRRRRIQNGLKQAFFALEIVVENRLGHSCKGHDFPNRSACITLFCKKIDPCQEKRFFHSLFVISFPFDLGHSIGAFLPAKTVVR
jgi:hypothetical protein